MSTHQLQCESETLPKLETLSKTASAKWKRKQLLVLQFNLSTEVLLRSHERYETCKAAEALCRWSLHSECVLICCTVYSTGRDNKYLCAKHSQIYKQWVKVAGAEISNSYEGLWCCKLTFPIDPRQGPGGGSGDTALGSLGDFILKTTCSCNAGCILFNKHLLE